MYTFVLMKVYANIQSFISSFSFLNTRMAMVLGMLFSLEGQRLTGYG